MTQSQEEILLLSDRHVSELIEQLIPKLCKWSIVVKADGQPKSGTAWKL
jgi:hypothetical protein